MESSAPFSLESLTQLYQKLDFANRGKRFEIFFPENG